MKFFFVLLLICLVSFGINYPTRIRRQFGMR